MVAVDHLTKWAEAWPIPDQEDQTLAQVLVEQFLTKFGSPMMIHTDQGRNFEFKLFQEMCKLLGIKKTRTTSFHPQSNWLVEQLNKIISILVTSYISENQHTWDEHLAVLRMAY